MRSFIDDEHQPEVGAAVFEMARDLGGQINRIPADLFATSRNIEMAAGNPPSMEEVEYSCSNFVCIYSQL